MPNAVKTIESNEIVQTPMKFNETRMRRTSIPILPEQSVRHQYIQASGDEEWKLKVNWMHTNC